MSHFVTCVMLTTHPKRAGFLADAAASYRAQTHPRRELLVINDGPQPLRSTESDVRVVNLPAPMSLGEKRNVGLRFAYGDLIATWDDDDVSPPERLAEQVAAIRETGAHYVVGDRMFIADGEMRVQGRCQRAHRTAMPTAVFRRDTAVRVGGYPSTSYLEDFELLERFRMVARAPVVKVPSEWYVMRRHGANVTLGFGEQDDVWIACDLRDPDRDRAQAGVDAIRAMPRGGLE